MGQGRPTGASYGAAHASIDLDLTSLTSAPRVAQAAGEATAKALQQSLKIVQNEQKIAIANAQQAAAAAQAQQAQVTATAKAESAERIALARSEAAATQQQARAQTATTIEEQRRQTAAFKQELKDRSRAQQQSQVSAGSFAQGAASFAGAAIGGPIGGLVGAATAGNPGIAAGVAVNMGARAAVDASQVATAYNRQNVAALQLAGSQNRLNDLLAAYDQATGGAIDNATELANVTKLEAVGFADSVPELDKFATAIRGISIAMGQPQDMVTQNLVLELFSQRGQRLDQLGLNYEKVKQRVKELEAADGSLTAKQAYQNAVLEQAEQRYGKLAKSAEGAATGMEQAGKASADLQLEIGKVISPFVNLPASALADWITNQTNLVRGYERAWKDLSAAMQRAIGISVPTGMQQRFIASSAGRDVGRHGGYSGPTAVNPNADQIQQVHLDWAKGITDLDAQTHAAIIDEENSFGQARAKTVADYNKSVARDEASYARSRLRANLDFLDSIADVSKDAARREEGEATNLARTIAKEQADSADKVADIRKDSAKQLKEIEENYQADQVKAARHFKNEQMDAAGSLDAKRVAELQRSFGEQQQDAKEAHDKQIKDNGAQLKERLDDEAKSLAKSIKEQQDAYDLQISEGRANDALKIQDMKDAFTKSQSRAAEDHGIEVAQRAQDQADELTAMDAQHNLRLTQIADHAQADRDALDDQAKADLLALGVRNDAWQKVADAKEKHQERLWDDFMDHVNGTLLEGRPNTPQAIPAGFASGGFVQRGGMARVHANEFILSGGMMSGQTPIPSSVRNAVGANGNGGGMHIGSVSATIVLGDIGDRSDAQVKTLVRQGFMEIMKEVAA